MGKAGYSGSWAPPTATAQAQHSFLELTGPEPASRVPLAVRYSPAPPGLSQSERLDGRGFQQRGGEWVWIGSLEDGDVAEGGRFVSELRLVLSRAGVCDRKRKWRKDAGVGIRAGETGAVMGLLFCFFNSSRPQSDALPLQGGGWVRGMSACEARRLPAFTPPSRLYFPPGPSARAHRHPDQQAAR